MPAITINLNKPSSGVAFSFYVMQGEKVSFSKKADAKTIEDELLRLNARMAEYFGNFFSFVIMSRMEFRSRHKEDDQLVKSIAKDAKVISGKMISELL